MVEELNRIWGKSGHISFSQKPDRPVEVELKLKQVSFINENDKELIFVSSKTAYVKIRGGIPVIFPQFGPGVLPQHGFARESDWDVVETIWNEVQSTASITLSLRESQNTLKVWPHNFSLTIETSISFTDKPVLSQKMTVVNTGENEFSFTTALHTYFKVDVRNTIIKNLSNLNYFDKILSQEKHNKDNEFRITGPTDNVFYNAPKSIEILDGTRNLTLKTENFNDLVTWNCWEQGAKNIADMGDNDWPDYVCVEPATVKNPIKLSSKQSWSGVHSISYVDTAKL